MVAALMRVEIIRTSSIANVRTMFMVGLACSKLLLACDVRQDQIEQWPTVFVFDPDAAGQRCRVDFCSAGIRPQIRVGLYAEEVHLHVLVLCAAQSLETDVVRRAKEQIDGSDC